MIELAENHTDDQWRADGRYIITNGTCEISMWMDCCAVWLDNDTVSTPFETVAEAKQWVAERSKLDG